jgi:hypothetical protein
MKDAYHIKDVPLKQTMDFKILKDKALEIIQQQSGNEWTNYNPADPGVTILDQLCYALTELGYCMDFPIEDILTDENGEINFEEQFFQAQEILSSAPVTAHDFKRLLISKVSGLRNLELQLIPAKLSPVYGIYQTYLALVSDTDLPAQEICKNAFLTLNQGRNVGSFFLMPQPLKVKRYYLHATLSIRGLKDLSALFLELNHVLTEWIFPSIQPMGYRQLRDSGLHTNSIISGPVLKNGWIPDTAMAEKKCRLKLIEVFNLLMDHAQVLNVEHMELEGEDNQGHFSSEAMCGVGELLGFDLKDDLLNHRILLKVEGNELITEEERQQYLVELKKEAVLQPDAQKSEAQTFNAPEVPKGTYREIEAYYSIQNTFPEVFAVGKNASTEKGTPYQKALSRQLGAYLTLFDQSMGNQFSQLASLDKLLSFKNYLVADVPDQRNYAHVGVSDKYTPAPYQTFAPTYFYQSLYSVPNIQPLLKGVEAFEFSDSVDLTNVDKEEAWKRYQINPYNAYIRGLMEFVESPSTAYQRRNQALDHLLARHGQSPVLVDALIEGSFYTGEKARDRIIFKSLYLQNFALLNYHKQSASDFLGARRLLINKGFGLNKEVIRALLAETEADFIFQTEKIDSLEKIAARDFQNFSGVQLKFNLLFGLRNSYRNFILEQWNPLFKLNATQGCINKPMEQAYWFMQQKGCVFIETSVLAMLAHYEILLSTTSSGATRFFRLGQLLSYQELLWLEAYLEDPDATALMLKEASIRLGENVYELQALNARDVEGLEFSVISEAPQLSLSFIADWGQQRAKAHHTLLENKLLLVLPDFIDAYTETTFLKRLELLMQDSLPLHMGYDVFYASSVQLEVFIPTYIDWHNGLRYIEDLTPEERLEQSTQTQSLTDALISQLLEFQKVNPRTDV